MSDAMVTARMSSTKKEAGNKILEKIGTNASQAVNDLYDYVLENGVLPWQKGVLLRPVGKEELTGAMKWVEGLQIDVSPEVSGMSIKDAKRARLGLRSERR